MRLKNLPLFLAREQGWSGFDFPFGWREGFFSPNRLESSSSASSPSPAQWEQCPSIAYGFMGNNCSSGRRRMDCMMASLVPHAAQTNLPLSGTLPLRSEEHTSELQS